MYDHAQGIESLHSAEYCYLEQRAKRCRTLGKRAPLGIEVRSSFGLCSHAGGRALDFARHQLPNEPAHDHRTGLALSPAVVKPGDLAKGQAD